MTLSHLTDNTFVGIDVGGAGLDVAWHRGDLRNERYRPDNSIKVKTRDFAREQPDRRLDIQFRDDSAIELRRAATRTSRRAGFGNSTSSLNPDGR